MKVRQCIEGGDGEGAIDQVLDLNPEILEDRPQLLFRLKKQQFIQMVRDGETEKALEFAERELACRIDGSTECLVEELEEAMSLLLFENPAKSPVAHLLDARHRHETASELNEAILRSESMAGPSKLPRLIKILVWMQNRLSQHMKFPVLPIRPNATLIPPPTLEEEGGNAGAGDDVVMEPRSDDDDDDDDDDGGDDDDDDEEGGLNPGGGQYEDMGVEPWVQVF